MYIQNINIGWHEQDPERLDPPLVWSPNNEKQGQVNLRASGTLLQSCTMTGFPRVATWPASPLSRGNLSFPWAAASTCRISSPSISPVTPKIRAYNCIVFWSTRKRDARSASTSLSPWCITWQDGCCNISMTCTIRESMLIWSSKMAVTTEMRKSARNLALMWSHFVGIRFSYTFLDGALQSGQRSKDLDLPTSDSSSPSASNNQFNSTSTTGTSATRISTNGTSISSSVNALPWVLTNSTTASRSPSPEQIGWQRILAFPWEKMCFCISNKNNHPGSREITFGVSNVILLISASCTACIRWKVLFCFVCCLFAPWW